MRGAVMYAPGDIRVEERDAPKIIKPTDAVIRRAATIVCGSDLWDWRGINPVPQPAPMGHEYAGIFEEVGRDVRTVKPGQFVVGSFFASDNTSETCLRRGPPARGAGPGAPVPARADWSHRGPAHRPGQGVRTVPAARPGGRGLPGHGRTPRRQGPPPAVGRAARQRLSTSCADPEQGPRRQQPLARH